MVWWPAATWAKMRSGEGCQMCASAHMPTNDDSDLVLELRASYARLHRNQTRPGYTVVILKRHANELYELPPPALRAFWADVAWVGAAVADLFAPVKLDNLVLGHQVPHLHCHVLPQYETDDPLAPIDVNAGTVRLSPTNQAERVAMLRDRLLNGG
ncbi:MAG: HIT family protein [Pseudonocardiales bacterium]